MKLRNTSLVKSNDTCIENKIHWEYPTRQFSYIARREASSYITKLMSWMLYLSNIHHLSILYQLYLHF